MTKLNSRFENSEEWEKQRIHSFNLVLNKFKITVTKQKQLHFIAKTDLTQKYAIRAVKVNILINLMKLKISMIISVALFVLVIPKKNDLFNKY